MTRLSITILTVFVPVTASHQPYIVSNVSLEKKKILTDAPPLPTHDKCPVHSDPLVSCGFDQV